jgi:hypothetical protein
VITETSRSWRDPASTAAKIAVRSAQMHRPYDAFSTLAPVKTLPSVG